MSERTETVRIVIPVPPEMTGGELGRGLRSRVDDAYRHLLAEQHLRGTGDPFWRWQQMTADEIAAEIPDLVPFGANAWLATAEVSVTD
jgi:hypothetical protein